MKKLLFCAGILALAASCTEEFDTVSVQQEQAKGISFAEVENVLAPTTKGEFEVNDLGNGKVEFTPFWTAEKDKIGVFATGVIKNPEAAKLPGDDSDQASATWSDGLKTTNKVSYKATRSERYAYFTATNQSDLLDFAEDVDEEKPATFLAVYPNGMGLNKDVTPDWTNGFSFQLKLPALVEEQNQSNTEGKGVYELNAKYAIAKGAPLSDRQEAVGESVELRFNRVLGGMAFSTKNVDKYTSEDNNLFGKLKSVKMKMLGEATQDAEGNITVLYTGEDDDTHKAPSKLTNAADAIVQIDVTVNGTEYESGISKKSKEEGNATDYKTETGVSEVTVKLNGNDGLEWTDADRAYMVLAPVSRGKNTSEEWREALELTYTFEYIDFVKKYTTTADWPAGEFGDMKKLDIDEYPYLVTKNRGTSNTRALIVNSGSFSDIFVEGSENGKIEWNDTEKVNPGVEEFSTIIVNEGVTLTKSELDMLKKFTNLAEITLAENTEIPNGTFNVNTISGKAGQPLVKIDFPKVITIGKEAFGKDGLNGTPNGITDGMKLATVLLPSYEFGDAEIARSFLNPATLVTLDMSAVEAMNVGFPSTGFTLDGFARLKTIYVQDGIDLGSNAFSGCKVLANVLKKNEDGTTAAATVDLKGTSVFRDCDALVSVNIGGTEIPANSFNDCDLLENVLVGGVQVVPTSVGLGAFQNCVALEKMDLSQAVDKTVDSETIPAIGDDAFNGCKAFYGGVNAENKVIVQVGGQTIGENAFAGCTSLVHIEFLAATSLGDGVLNIGESGALKQIQLDKRVTFRNNQSGDTFGAAKLMANVDLFITPGQAGVNGNTLTLGSKTVTFKSIRDRAAD